MNILVLSDAFWPDHTGGISKSLLPEVEELAARGHRVVVVARKLKKSLPFHELRNGYELYRYSSPPKGSSFYRLYPLFSIRQVPKLVSQLHGRFHFDTAYIINNPFQAVGLMRASLKIPYVYVFYAPIPREIELDATRGKYGWSTPMIKVVNQWIKTKEYQTLSSAKRIIVRSDFSKKEIHQYYGKVDDKKIVKIPLCVNTKRFSFADNPLTIRERLGLPLNRPILLTVRRLVARMGLENLLVATKEVAKQIPDVLLLMGGKGYLENHLLAQIRKLQLEQNVRLLGFIPEGKLPMYYQAADLFVLPTVDLEGFGLATIEALSCGTPVIATPIGANPEVVGPLGKEFICDNATPEALAVRIIWFIRQGVNIELRNRCRSYCESNFTIKKVVDHLEQILSEALDI